MGFLFFDRFAPFETAAAVVALLRLILTETVSLLPAFAAAADDYSDVFMGIAPFFIGIRSCLPRRTVEP